MKNAVLFLNFHVGKELLRQIKTVISAYSQQCNGRFGGTWWCGSLRHCTTNRKAAGSIPDGVTGIFHWHNPSGRTMSLGSTQPLTEMSTRNISWGIKAAGVWGWKPYHLHVLNVLKSGSLKLLEPSRPVQACNGIALPSALQLGIQTFCDTMPCQWRFATFRASSGLMKRCEPLAQWHSITPQ